MHLSCKMRYALVIGKRSKGGSSFRMNIENYDQEVRALNDEMLKARALLTPNYINLGTKLVRKAKEIDDNNLLGYAYYYRADAYYLLSND